MFTINIRLILHHYFNFPIVNFQFMCSHFAVAAAYGANTIPEITFQPTISLEMPVPSQGHYGFKSFPIVD